MITYTKGPWASDGAVIYNPQSRVLRQGGGILSAILCRVIGMGSPDALEARGNLRLILQAPMLYEALQGLSAAYGRQGTLNDQMIAWDKARAVLQAIEGGVSVTEEQNSPVYTDDEITAFIADPVRILDHDTARTVIEVLDQEIASIQMQLDVKAVMRGGAISRQDEDWVRRAAYAKAIRQNERDRVYKRVRELRGTQQAAQAAGKGERRAANLLKQERLVAEARTRQLTAQAKAEEALAKLLAAQRRNRQQKLEASLNYRFYAAAKRMLPPALFDELVTATKEQAA